MVSQSIQMDHLAAGLLIEPRDASGFWSQAARKWGSINGTLKLQASEPDAERAPPSESPASPAQASPRKSKKRPLVPEEEERERAAGGARTSCRRESRLPATPCRSSNCGTEVSPSEEGAAETTAPNGTVPCAGSGPCGTDAVPCASPVEKALRRNRQGEDVCCGICFESAAPGKAVLLACGHGWYCEDCVLKYADERLALGATSISCPECTIAVPECDLRKVLPAERMNRLLHRSLEQAVSSAADLWSCPTPNCPMRVALDLEDGEIPQLKCTLCKKSSCLRCGAQPYHKNLTCEEYAERLKESERRGTGKLSKQQKAAEEATASMMRWMQQTGTRQCPTCRIAVSKQDLKKQESQRAECHKMVCRNCKTRFCFKCLAILTDTYTCGCSIDAHGFVDPRTGKRIEHLKIKAGRTKPVAKGRAR